MMKRTTIVTCTLALLLAACGAESAPSPDPAALDTGATETTQPAPTTTTTSPVDETTTTTATTDEEMDEHDEEMDEHDEEMDEHDEEMDEHDEMMDEHREGEFIPEATGEPTMEIDIVMTDFAFEPNPVALPAGETVRFHLINDGVIQHEFRLSNAHRIEEHIAAGHEDHGEDAEHHEGAEADVIVLIDPGETRVVDITLPADTEIYTTVACLLPDHYEAGMHVPIEYQ